MRKRFARRMRQFMLAFAIIFFASIFFIFGEARINGGRMPKEWRVVAKVDRTEITRNDFNARLAQEFRAYGGEPGIAVYVPIKASVLDRMIEEVLKVRAAKAMRVKVGRRDIRKAIDEMVDSEIQALKGRFPSERRFKRFVKHKYGSMTTLRRDIERKLRSDPELMASLKLSLLFRKLEEKVRAKVKVEEEDLLKQYDMVRIRQIVIKVGKKRGEGEARKLARRLAERARKGEDFSKLAEKFSEDEKSARLGGDIGWIKRGTKPEPFERVAFALKKGEVSEPVKVGDAFYILKCEGRKRELPKDFERRKKQLLEDLRRRRQTEAWFQFLDDLRRRAKIEVLDPELAAYRAYAEGNYKRAYELYKKAVKMLERVEEAGGDPFFRPGPLYYQISLVCERLKKEEEAVSWLRRAWEETEDPEVALRIGDILKDMGRKEEAIKAYKQAREYASDDPYIHQRLKSAFESLGLKEEAEKEKKWLDEYYSQR